MAIAVDAITQGTISGTASLTISHTVGTGSDRALYVFVVCHNSSDFMSAGSVAFGGAGFGSRLALEEGQGQNWLSVFRLTAPSSGTANIVITPSAGAFLHAYCISLSGVDQTTPEATIVSSPAGTSGATSSSPLTTTVTLGTDGLALDMISRRVGSSSLTLDGTQTRVGTEITAGGLATSGASYKAGSGSTGMVWTFASTSNVSHLVVPVNAAAGGDTTAPVLTSPTGTATGSTTATVGATTDEANGTMYAVVTTSVTQPSIAQIKAGQNDGGTSAAWSGTQSIATTGAKTLSATGLAASTAYYAHLIHTDAAANDSNRVTSSSFTTSAPSGSAIAAISNYYRMMRNA